MSETHARNTQAMRASPRCGATTRKGTPCQAPAVSGKSRCRMHGGARGSGAPNGNQNAFKHGQFSRDTVEWKAHVAKLIREGRKLIEEI